MPWIVKATEPKQEAGKVRPLWPFKENFFPRTVHYKKDAVELAHQARSYGGSDVSYKNTKEKVKV